MSAGPAPSENVGPARPFTGPALRSYGARVLDAATNGWETLRGIRDPTVPPRRLRLHVGAFRDPRLFVASGAQTVRALHELASLRESARVLDIGCGVGRLAGALTRDLGPNGSYDGFDVAEEPVRWCQENIQSRFPNFRFVHTNVHSSRYNPAGGAGASKSRFPYDDGRFDVVFAGSVYTHMIPEEIAGYVQETARVLRPGGVAFATFCLLNERSLSSVMRGTSFPRLPDRFGDCWVRDVDDLASFVAQPEQAQRRIWEAAGLRIREPIRYGSWIGPVHRPEIEEPYGINQDIVLVDKPL